MKISISDLNVIMKYCNKNVLKRLKSKTIIQIVAKMNTFINRMKNELREIASVSTLNNSSTNRILIFQYLRNENLKFFVRMKEKEREISLSTFSMNQIVWCRDQNAIEHFRNFDALDQNQHFHFLWRSQHDDRHWDVDWCKCDENVRIDCERNCLHEIIKKNRFQRRRTNQCRVKVYFRRDDQRNHSTTFCLKRKNSHMRKNFS